MHQWSVSVTQQGSECIASGRSNCPSISPCGSLSNSLAQTPDKCQSSAWCLLPRSARRCEDSLSRSSVFSIFPSPSPFPSHVLLFSTCLHRLPSYSSAFSPQSISVFLLFSCFSSFCTSNSPLFVAYPSTSSSFFSVSNRGMITYQLVPSACVCACGCVRNRGVVTA